MNFENNIIGKKIVIKKANKRKNEGYISQILDIIDDNTYIISGPIMKKNFVFFHINEIIEVSYIIEDKGRFYFKARITERTFENVYFLKVLRITNVSKLQERNFYRLNILLEILKSHYAKTQSGMMTIEEKCESVDLSGGGMQLRCNYSHSIGDNVNIILTIDDTPIALNGKIIRINLNDTYGYKYLIGIKFVDFKNKDRDKIIQYIFDEQRKLIEKGLI